MTTPHEAVTEALRIQANTPFAGPKQKKAASVAIEALREGAEDRALEVTLNADGFPTVDADTVHVIVNAILGVPTEGEK